MLEKGDSVLERIEAQSLLLADLPSEEGLGHAVQIATLRQQLGDPTGAYAAYQQALVLRPAATEALEPALRFLENKEEFEEMARLLSIAAQAPQRPAERASLLRRLAEIFETKLADPRRAVQVWWQAWEEKQRGEEAASLKRICGTLQDWRHYSQVLLRQAQSAS